MFVPTSAYVVRMELSYLGLSERGQLQCRIASSSETVTLSFCICYTTAAQLCEWCAAVRQTKNFRHKIRSLCANLQHKLIHNPECVQLRTGLML